MRTLVCPYKVLCSLKSFVHLEMVMQTFVSCWTGTQQNNHFIIVMLIVSELSSITIDCFRGGKQFKGEFIANCLVFL